MTKSENAKKVYKVRFDVISKNEDDTDVKTGDRRGNENFKCSICKDRRTFLSLSAIYQHCEKKHRELRNLKEALQNEKGQQLLDKHLTKIMYDDKHLAILIKPRGVETNKFAHSETLLLLDKPLRNLKRKLQDNTPDFALSFPKPVHRIDKATGGLLIFAKTTKAISVLCQMFREHKIRKTYQALVLGHVVDEQGKLDKPISGKESVTLYEVQLRKVIRGIKVTKIELTPLTGRRHQLRKHLANAGHPIVGDSRYGRIDSDKAVFHLKSAGYEGLQLFAVGLQFEHPIFGKMVEIDERDKTWVWRC